MPGQRLIVCSGIAIPNWDSQGSIDSLDVRIKLNVKATALYGWTAVAGLAGITNDDTEFLFTTDWVRPDNPDEHAMCTSWFTLQFKVTRPR